MQNSLCLDENFSTTKLINTELSTISAHFKDKFETLSGVLEKKYLIEDGGLRTKKYYKNSYETMPLISIVTIVFNGETHLEETILSVLNQTYSNVEYIIIDGGSNDGTLDIIKKYENQIDYWISAKDDGISDAFNKGISLCTGDIIGIINADDYYEPSSLETVAEAYSNDIDIIYGKMRYWFTPKKYIDVSGTHMSLEKEMNVHHPAVFVSRNCYKKSGLFLKDYKYAMDYELMLRFYVDQRTFLYVDKVLSNMRAGGESNKFLIQSISEMRKAQLLYLNGIVSIYLTSYTLLIRRLFSSMLKYLKLHFIINLYRKIRG